MSFLPDEGKLDMVRKLRDLMKARQDRGDYSLQAAEPDVFRVDNDNLWFVVNQGDHFAFKDPEFPGVTVVMSSEFAMRALALGFLPAFPPPPKKKRVDACS
jgi:hypothetical protein